MWWQLIIACWMDCIVVWWWEKQLEIKSVKMCTVCVGVSSALVCKHWWINDTVGLHRRYNLVSK